VGGCSLQPIDTRISRAHATLSLPSPFLFISSKLHFHLLHFLFPFRRLFDSSPDPPAHRVYRSLTTPIASVATVLPLHIFRPLFHWTRSQLNHWKPFAGSTTTDNRAAEARGLRTIQKNREKKGRKAFFNQN
jgi:hypothetical protein